MNAWAAIGLQAAWRCITATVGFALIGVVNSRAADAAPSRSSAAAVSGTNLPPVTRVAALAELNLEELTQIEVTSVSKKAERLSEASAAVHVITADDIRRSGATTIPDALRLAPGIEVARVDSHSWAITSRGFNALYANKLLVLIDGRTIYTPLFSGVFWDVQDTVLEDIDHIEVIRGPGATLWGANAVNGVINITTKSSKLTQGTLIDAGYGTEEQGFASIRHGGELSREATYRVYGKYFNRDESVLSSGDPANDAWYMYRGGVRLDWEPGDRNLLTFQGDAYTGVLDQTFILDTTSPPYSRADDDKTRVYGGNVLGRWSHTFSEKSELRVQTYFDRTSREADLFNEDQNTVDVEVQQRFALGDWNDIVAGVGYRYVNSFNLKSNFNLSFNPRDRATHLYNIFVQDEITVIPDRLFLTLGSKFEHNDYTGFEVQPSGRLLWTPHQKHTLWGAVSRAVRSPSRGDNDIRVVERTAPPGSPGFPPSPFANVVTLDGNPDFKSEVLYAYELGYRVQPARWASLDLALFYNEYDDLRSFESAGADMSNVPAYLRFPQVWGNGFEGETYGGELAANVQLADWWQLRASYSYLQIQLHKKGGSTDPGEQVLEQTSPHHQASIRSLIELPWNLQFDCVGRYVDSLPAIQAPSYITVDLRLGWRPRRNLELSITAQNVFDDRHPEFNGSVVGEQRTEVERAVYGRITWKF